MSIFENEKFIVANFKQSGSMTSMKEWLVEFKKQISEIGELKINIVLCPSFQFLDLFNRKLTGTISQPIIINIFIYRKFIMIWLFIILF